MVYGNKFINESDMSLLVLEQELSNPIIINELSIDDIKSKLSKLVQIVVKWIKEAWENLTEAFGKLKKIIKEKIDILFKRNISKDNGINIEIEYYDVSYLADSDIESAILEIKNHAKEIENDFNNPKDEIPDYSGFNIEELAKITSDIKELSLNEKNLEKETITNAEYAKKIYIKLGKDLDTMLSSTHKIKDAVDEINDINAKLVEAADNVNNPKNPDGFHESLSTAKLNY